MVRTRLLGVVAVLAVAGAALLGGVGAVGAGAVTPTAGQKVFVEPGIYPGPPKYRPHEFLLSGDGTFSLYAVHYESYGGPVATATGRGYVRGCTPNCAAGKVYRSQAKIKLSQVTKCEGKLIYAKLQYSLTGPVAKGFKRQGTYDMRPFGENGKPVC